LSERFQHQSLTVSVGLAMYTPSYRTYLELVAAADRAMYQAKDEGRNRVVML
jgi:diguanylate cyclase (GGDEF)-like protein